VLCCGIVCVCCLLFALTDHIRHINDPEHPLTLEQLNVTQLENIRVDAAARAIDIKFTPVHICTRSTSPHSMHSILTLSHCTCAVCVQTIPHCSMATLIGLCLRVKCLRSLPSHWKVSVAITPGTHASEHAINKQLRDKERVAAALENAHLLDVVNKCIAHTDDPPATAAAAAVGAGAGAPADAAFDLRAAVARVVAAKTAAHLSGKAGPDPAL
jgi:hypothetical protein